MESFEFWDEYKQGQACSSNSGCGQHTILLWAGHLDGARGERSLKLECFERRRLEQILWRGVIGQGVWKM